MFFSSSSLIQFYKNNLLHFFKVIFVELTSIFDFNSSFFNSSISRSKLANDLANNGKDSNVSDVELESKKSFNGLLFIGVDRSL